MQKILFIRHGQSLGNVKCVFCGRMDYPLTDAGKTQGAAACEFVFSNYKVCALYSSELTRAKQTLERLSELSGLPLVVKSAFNELYGGLWEDKTVPEIAKNYPQDFSVWEKNIGEAVPTGGESFPQLIERAKKGLCEIADECKGKDGVAVVATHGGVIRALQCVLNGLPLSEMKNIPWVSNASVTCAGFDNGRFSIDMNYRDDFLGDKKTVMFMGL